MASIRVSNPTNHTVWQSTLEPDEFQKVKGYMQGRDTVPIPTALFSPTRTNNFKNLSKDFFLPTTMNHAIKVQNLTHKIFAILGALILDLATCIFRVWSTIPKIIINARQEQIPLHKYLISKGVDEKLLDSDHVLVRLEWERPSQFPETWVTLDGETHQKYGQERHQSEQMVNFIELPVYEGSDHFESSMIG